MRPIYFKDRHVVEPRYRQRLLRNPAIVSESAVGLTNYNDTFYPEENNDHKYETQDDLGMPVNYARIKALEENIRRELVSDKNSLHRAITPILILGNVIGLLPVQGIRGQNTGYLTFNWFSWSIMYVFIIILLCLMIITFSVVKIFKIGLTYNTTGEIVFFGGSVVIYIIFIHLAKKWPKIMAKWELLERETKQFRNSLNINYKFKVLMVVIMILALIEHAVSIFTTFLKAIPCSSGGLDIFRVYFSISFEQVFTLTDYSFLKGFLLEVLDLILACAWNFMDLFIIVISCALSDKFKQLNERLGSVNGKILPSTYWRQSREIYNRLASLTRDFDEFLSPVVLLSFAHNLYFICLQLLNGLRTIFSVWEVIGFMYLFIFLVGRTSMVTLYAASINDESKKPKAVLFFVPTESYGLEVARFITQVASDELSLTGYNFFSVTRTFMLTVAGTIVTYEIVLIQFNSISNEVINLNNTLSYCP